MQIVTLARDRPRGINNVVCHIVARVPPNTASPQRQHLHHLLDEHLAEIDIVAISSSVSSRLLQIVTYGKP